MLEGRERLSLDFEVKVLRRLIEHFREWVELAECHCKALHADAFCGRCAMLGRIDADLGMIGQERGPEQEDRTAGDAFLIEGDKDPHEAKWLKGKLQRQGVKDPRRTEIAERYDTRYIVRHIRQIRKDDPDNEKFSDHGGVLVARIIGGYGPLDFPAETFENWQWPGAKEEDQ